MKGMRLNRDRKLAFKKMKKLKRRQEKQADEMVDQLQRDIDLML